MAFTTRQAASEHRSAQEAAAKPSVQLFNDQRASTATQLKQQQMMTSSQSAPLQRVEDEELLQGKFETAQLMEEEEPLQGKFVAQRVEEEEPLQGKFATAQLMEEEEPIQGKFEPLQRAAEEEEPLQGKFSSNATAQREQKPNNTGMPDNLKSGIENLSGYSMDDVKVHYNSDKPAQLNAHAYAQGTDIHVAPGQEQHLPHEAWHVVQQKQGRVQPTMQMKAGVPVNDDVSLESEADAMGAKAIQLKTFNGSVTLSEKILPSDLADWNKVRVKLGGISDGGDAYEIGKRVNKTLKELGLDNGLETMSAHMVPNRIGGLGTQSNVRAWKKSFENGTWKTSVEDKFDAELLKAEKNDTVKYVVNTTDMDDTKAQKIVDSSTNDAEKAKSHHKDRIKEIPLSVNATVGAESLADTDECFSGLIK